MKLKKFIYFSFGVILTTYGTLNLVSAYVGSSFQTNSQLASITNSLDLFKNLNDLAINSNLKPIGSDIVLETRLPIDEKGNFEVGFKKDVKKLDFMMANHNGSFYVGSDFPNFANKNSVVHGSMNSDNLFPSVLQNNSSKEIERLIIKDDIDFQMGYKNTYLHFNPLYRLPLKLDILSYKSEGIMDTRQIRLETLVATLENSIIFITIGDLSIPREISLLGNQNKIYIKIPNNYQLEISKNSSPDLVIKNTILENSDNLIYNKVPLKIEALRNSEIYISN